MFHCRADGLADVTVNFGDVQQTMDGFGACDRNSVELTDPLADLFFDQATGIGLSLLRTTMFDDGTGTGYPANYSKAVARGAKVWVAPWTAPAAWKDNGSTINGGHLLVASYGAWADRLCAFQTNLLADSGVNLYAISIQNEPDYSAPYSSMLYTTAEMVAFAKVLWPKMQLLSPIPRLIFSEVASQANFASYVTAMLADGTTAPYVDIVAWHQYDGTNGTPIASHPNWQTEMSYFDAFDATMTSALTMSASIHSALITGNVSAWHYWELTAPQSDNEGLIGHDGGTQTTKRVYALGNWSKFVRPGMVRVGTTGTITGVSISAFKNASTGAYAVVVVNPTAGAISKVLSTAGATVTPWITDATRDLVAQTALPVVENCFTASLPALSVTTFAGMGA